MSSQRILDGFTSMIAKNLLTHAGKKEEYVVIWPMPVVHLFEADGYVARTFPHVLYNYVKELEKKGHSDQEISRFFKWPTRIADYAWLLKLKELMRLTISERTELYSKLLDYISFFRKDIFCRSRKNLLWSDREVNACLKEHKFIDLSSIKQRKQYQRLVGRFNADLWSYAELLYFAAHGMGHEFHGPYNLPDGNVLIVRQYYDLNAEFWDFAKELPWNKVTSFEIYKGIEVNFDFFNRTITKKPLPSHLIKFSATANGSEIDTFENLEELLWNIENTIREGIATATSLEAKGLIKKYIEAHFFTLKPLALELGRDWKPPKEIYDIVNREEVRNSSVLSQKYQALQAVPSLSQQQKFKFFKNMYDPRI